MDPTKELDESKVVRILLESKEEFLIAQWADSWLDGYLENLQDDQSRCYRCGDDEDLHPDKLNTTFGVYLGLGPHEYVGEWPEFRTKFELFNSDGTVSDKQYWVITKSPEIVLEYLVDAVLDQDYKDVDPKEFEDEYGSPPPPVEVAKGLITKIFEQYPELDIPNRRFEIIKSDGQSLDSNLPLWSVYDMDFSSQSEADAVLKMKVGDSFTEDDGVKTTRVK